MSKYVIDLEVLQSDPSGIPTLWKGTLVFDKYGKQKLTPLSSEVCIEELQKSGWMAEHDKIIFEQGKECCINDIGSIIAYARKEGYEDGHNDGYNAAQTGEYQRGLEDAWEAAKNLSIMTPEEAEKVFPGAEKYNRFNLGYSGAEAIKKLQDYMQKEKADQEIRVGDEVEYCCDDREKYVVLRTYLNVSADTMLTVLHRGDGDIDSCPLYHNGVAIFRKTGNHFPQVADLMTELGGTDA